MFTSETKRPWLLWASLTSAVCVIGIFLIYWPIIRTGFSSVSSDPYDGQIMIAMLEHWHNVYQLQERPLDPIYFYPFKGALALNESNVLSGAAYSLFRGLGTDPYLAYELVNWLVRVVGAVSTIILARKVLRLGLPYAMGSGFLFLIVTNLAYRMAHSQLLFASFFPLGILLFSAAFEHLATLKGERKWPILLAISGLAAFIALWALTAFYSLYIFCFFLLAYFLAIAALDQRTRTKSTKILTCHPGLVAFALAALGAAVVAVLAIYGRALSHGHSVEGLRSLAGRWIDLWNVGTGNVVWSPVLASIYPKITGTPLTSSELSTGFTPILSLTFLGSTVWLVATYNSSRERPRAMALALSIACAIVALLCLKFGERAVWELFARFVPGAKALRVPMRYLLFLSPIVIVIAMMGLSRLPAFVGAVLFLFIAIEQIRNDLPFDLNRTAQLQFLDSIPPAPQQCKSFYVSVPQLPPSGNMAIDVFYGHSADAMLIAEIRKIPTLNGMTTFTPDGWDLHTPFAPDYAARVIRYAKRNGVEAGLCALDLKSKTWTQAD
ncbi:hypothetical protein [Bradyrhizobium sp. MOS002]|uniref:hypothetical protein n=1 Tax=Bradyrhizobium sp. MOS002 TaxID=2133947 RepID=UPI000D1315F8|nr:hypothetical protein [Bradyrhizobium sp. MOS002]PSO16861.1 hypothetical protein C7G41_36210 [Bradyrhizobium sp. MOS002]